MRTGSNFILTKVGYPFTLLMAFLTPMRVI
jgi:hypothetical protein